MKHNIKITFVILLMFLVTQLFGIYVVNYYSDVKVVQGNVIGTNSTDLPFGLEIPTPTEEKEYTQAFASIIIAFMIAIFLLLLLTKFNAEMIIKLWFFFVVALALGITFNILFVELNIGFAWLIAFLIGTVFSFIKIYKRNFLVHNFTEILIYPGIAAIFVSILNLYTLVFLLILISFYDIWAVWHSGIMQKMAKYQINKLNIFSGFFVPYMSKKVKMQIQKFSKSQLRKKKIKVSVAVLGGGDVVFPIIAAGVMLKTLGLMSALFVVLGATLGLTYLLFFSEKKKFYPAMPFITIGIFVGILVSYLVV